MAEQIFPIALVPGSYPQRTRVELAGDYWVFDIYERDAPDGMGGMFLDITNPSGVKILAGEPIVQGSKLLELLPDLKIPFDLFVYGNGRLDPTAATLGDKVKLYATIPVEDETAGS